MMMKVKGAEKKMKTMSEASRRPPDIFMVLNNKWGEVLIKA
jgi:hypothetical protein